MDFPTGAGATGGPISPEEAWKRAVYRSAPPRFYVELLQPEKQGGSHSYGLRIYPIRDDGASISTRNSGYLGYEIWRKWEDCLYFQETLEVTYSRMAREKRNRLAAGKGIKKNGIYIQGDQAASFESLPPGPDPHSVAQDIHQHIPKLTKRATLFRASQATIQQRQSEFKAMISAFFDEDMPTLIKELRETRTFTDFFGFWRRDYDLAKRQGRDLETMTSSVSVYFSASTPSLSDMVYSPSKKASPQKSHRRSSIVSDSSSSGSSVNGPALRRTAVQAQSSESIPWSNTLSNYSPTSPSLPSTPTSPPRQLSLPSRQTAVATQEVPVRFGHVPEVVIPERPTSLLESLPEDRELPPGFVGKSSQHSTPSRRRAGSTSEAHRSARIYGSLPRGFESLSEFGEQRSGGHSPTNGYPRNSWQTTHSTLTSRATTYLEELGVDYTLPTPNPESKHRPRVSMCSVASSVMPGTAVDAVMPRSSRYPSVDRRKMISFPGGYFILADEEPWVEYDESEEGDDLLDAYFYDSIPPEPSSPSATLDTPRGDAFQLSQSIPYRRSGRRSSLAHSVSSHSTASSHGGTVLTIKAAHEESIIMLRVPRTLLFTDLRQMIYDKFVQQEQSPISESFAIAVLVQPTPERGAAGAPQYQRPDSLSSADSKKAPLDFVASQEEWDQAVMRYGTKLSLRIIGSRE
ncbi:hypothetical protein EDD16DRAFT_1573164 [Pisolithus croceorrhizus]|nr:hypothetical protein EDD16DRAFT_1573164 [Pisolithus croceorrhizus]